MKSLIPFLKPYQKQLTLGPLAKLAEAVLELLLPLLMARLMDDGVQNKDSAYIIRISLWMAGVAGAGFLCSLFCQYSASIASQGFGTALRNALYAHISTLPRRDAAKFGAATLLNRQTADISQLQLAVAMLIRLVIRAPFLCIGGIVMAMTIDLKLSAAFFVCIPLFGIVLFVLVRKTLPLYRKAQGLLDKLSSTLRENLVGVRVVRAFGQTKAETERFNAANHNQAEAALQAGKLSALLSPITLLIMNATILFVVWFGGIRINNGGMTQGQLVAFMSYVTQIMLALIVLSNLVVLFTRAAAAGKRVTEVLETEPSMADGQNETMQTTPDTPIIEFQNVSFRFEPGAEPALDNISFCVTEGQTIGIVGGTGAGKSTLASLLLRFDDVTNGEIRVGGVAVQDWKLANLRSHIGLVPQKSLLFTGTIESNIRHGKPDATLEEIRQAADIAQASVFIDRLPNGFDTPIQQGGRNLSGGQRQCVTIARALVRRPDILILDDSASALDYLTDAKLRASLKTLHTKATFIISQRISAVMNADKILVLDDGLLKGQGDHIALLRSCPIYREICLSQGIQEEADA